MRPNNSIDIATRASRSGTTVATSSLFILALLVLTPAATIEAAATNGSVKSAAPAMSQVNLPFIENTGQNDPRVKFYANTFAGTVFVTDGGLTYSLIAGDPDAGFAFEERFAGAKWLDPEGHGKTGTVVNYFAGKPDEWKTGIPAFNAVRLGEVWPDVSVELNAHGSNVEKIFTVASHGDATVIRLVIDGSQSPLYVNDRGELVIETVLGQALMTKPVAFQYIDGVRNDVGVSYAVLGDATYGFNVGNYDRSYPLTIDPLLASTFLGGSGSELGGSVDLDSSGNVFVTGSAASSNFPTTVGAYNTTFGGGRDVSVSKFNSDLSTLLASTFIGGNEDDGGNAITVDASGRVFVAGFTSSPNFPTTPGVHDTTYGGGVFIDGDTFVAKLDNSLSTLLASTFLGGSDFEQARAITTGPSGSMFVTGNTFSTNFPTTPGAYDTSCASPCNGDAFVTKFDSNLALVASTYLGGPGGGDTGRAIAVDSAGNALVGGDTISTSFPTTPGAFDTTHNQVLGTDDAFLSKLDGSLTTLLASTFVAGDSNDHVQAVAVDSSDNVFAAGFTDSSNFYTVPGGYDTTSSSDDSFVLKFSSNLSTLTSATFLGGVGFDRLDAVVIDSSDNVFVTGSTRSSNFPTTPGAYDTTFNGGTGDVFVSKFNNSLSTLMASTFIGGTSGQDFAGSIDIDSTGSVYISGLTGASSYPTTAGAYDTSIDGFDMFISKFDSLLSANDTTPPTVSISSPADGTTTNVATVTISGTASDNPGGSGLQKVEVQIDAGAFSLASGTSSWTFGTGMLADGSHTITAKATDNAGTGAAVSITITVDTTPPEIGPLADVTGEAESPGGANVIFSTPAAIDNIDPDPNVVCDPASGSQFAIGITLVECTATDDAGNSASAIFTVEVLDTTPPELTVPGDMAVDELDTLAFIAMATDAASPFFTFSLSGAPGEASITSDGMFTFTPTEEQGPGSFTFEVIVSDGVGLTDSQTVTVTVNEVNEAPAVDAGDDQEVDEGASVSLSGAATDPDIPAQELTFSWTQVDGPAATLEGADTPNPTFTAPEVSADAVLTFELAVSDGMISSTDTVSVTVRQVNANPDAGDAVASIQTIWPPNNKMVSITIGGVTDGDGDEITITITGIMQDEKTGKEADASGVGTDTAEVRAERDGKGDGRVYHIFFTAGDGDGGISVGEVLVVVPHDKSGSPAVDQGVLYDSTTAG